MAAAPHVQTPVVSLDIRELVLTLQQIPVIVEPAVMIVRKTIAADLLARCV